MIDAVLTVANLVFWAGTLWAGFHLGRRTERRAEPVIKPLEAVCSCGHGYGKHPGNGQHCGGTTIVRREWTDYAGIHRLDNHADEVLECGCTRYDGPDPETVRMIRGA